jgi:Na+/melibiose symporter-like transporter
MALVDQPSRRRHSLDVRGAVALAGTVTLLLLTLEEAGAQDRRVPWPVVALGLVASVLLAAWFVREEQTADEPILPLDLFHNRSVTSTTIIGFFAGCAMFGLLSFVPLFVQSALGRTATEAGTALTPVLLGWVTMSMITARILPLIGARPLVVTGLVCVTLGFIGLQGIGRGSSLWLLRLDLALMGIGMGMTMLSLLLAQQNAVEPERLGTATSLGQFSRSIGGAFGVAMMGSVLGAVMAHSAGLPQAEALERGLRGAFLAGTIVAGAALASSALLPAGALRRAATPAPRTD